VRLGEALTRSRSPGRARLQRRSFLIAAASAFFLPGVPEAIAEDVAVPVSLQAELFIKVAAYDKNLAARAGDRVRVIILERPEVPESVRAAAQMQKALSQITDIAGIPHETQLIFFTAAADLAAAVKAKRASVVYITPGFDADIAAIAKAMTGASVLTVASLASYVPKRAVLGFDLVSGKPKLLVNITQAKAQSVAFKPDVLKLMKVYE
jgi:hypothetical protein